jgi:hypothetical protein
MSFLFLANVGAVSGEKSGREGYHQCQWFQLDRFDLPVRIPVSCWA